MLAMFFQSIVRGIASIKRLNMVLDCDPVVIAGDEEKLLQEEGNPEVDVQEEAVEEIGTVEFKDVSFSFPNSSGEVVLDHINLKINKGEKIGILGSTGCGKSTLVNLIPRFYDVTEGEILVDGKNVKDYKAKKIHSFCP